jgi:uncharacterized membrane protein
MEFNWRNFWFESKGVLQDTTGLQTDILHTHLGLAVFLVLCVLLRNRKRGMLVAWFCVFLIQIFNEALDARDWINWTGAVNWHETIKDSASTLFWPTVLLLLGPRWIQKKT